MVVGAGVAGLAAAGRLRAAGVRTTLIEAGARIGGRAWTTAIGGEPFDQGAAWLHDAERNPLVAMAPADALIDSDRVRRERVTVAGRVASAEELAAYEAAWDRMDGLAVPEPDATLAAAMGAMLLEPWGPLVALWEGAIIAAADADRLGAADWRRNRLEGRNAVPPEGVGAYVARMLGTEAALGVAATAIRYDGAGVRVDTTRGVIAADAVVVTVSTGVLASGAIRFEPGLPGAVAAAIGALPMGLLSKVAFPAMGRLGVAPDTVLVDRAGRMTFNAWPRGRGYVVGYMGGELAWSVAGDARAAAAVAREELGRVLGGDALRGLGAAVVTGWGTDPLSLGAYAYAGPGDAGARGVLGEALLAERVVFAGEAVRVDGLAGTVGGAFLSGVAAAGRLLG